MSGTVTEFATISQASSYFGLLYVSGGIYESVSEPYTDPSTGNTVELNEIIPVAGIVTLTDTTASGLVIPVGTASAYQGNGFVSDGYYAIAIPIPALGLNTITATVVSPGAVAASSLPTGYSDSITYTLQPAPITVTQTSDVVTDTVNEPAPQADLTVTPFSQVALTDPNPLQVDTASISVSGPVPYTLSLPNLQDLSASTLAAALDEVALSFSSPTSGTDTVTATITDNAGVTATLTSYASLIVPAVLGSGPDTLALMISQRGEPSGALFTISVDNVQIGGVQTTAASGEALGQPQVFDVAGTFAPGTSHTVTIDYLNANQSVLLVDGATIDGVEIPTADIALSNKGTDSFGFTASSAGTIGSGPESLTLSVAEQGEPSGAQYTVAINGTQVGGVQTTSANEAAGQTQTLTVLGTFSSTQQNTLTVTYLNANQSTFFVENLALDGQAGLFSFSPFTSSGSQSLQFAGPALTVPTIGSGPDALEFTAAEGGVPAAAQFTVSVDGAQIGGTQTATANYTVGQSQELLVLGNFAPGVSHSVSIDYLNANSSELVIANATINGTTIAGGSAVLSNVGSLGFTFTTPPGPAATPTTIGGSGPDKLALSLSEDYFQGNAQFSVSVDGTKVGGTQTVTAINGNGQSQLFDVLGNFAGTHTVSLTLLNPAAEGAGNAAIAAGDPAGSAPGLLLDMRVGGATLDGTAIANSSFALYQGTATQSFTFTH